MGKSTDNQANEPKITEAEKEFLEAKAKVRNFAFLVYPDSAPANWLDILENEHIEAFAILHDRDKNPSGELKKPHYHVLLMNKSPKSPRQWIALRNRIGGVGFERVNSLRGYSRYLLHLDNPEKAQYERSELLIFGGAEYDEAIHNASDNSKFHREIRNIILEYNILYLPQLYYFLEQNGRDDLINFIDTRGIYATREYMKSFAQMMRDDASLCKQLFEERSEDE